jgi:hypothetical protein
MRIMMFFAFNIYTTTSVLYLIDNFWFTQAWVWFYLIFTWLFLIFNQAVSIQPIIKRVWDLNWLILGQGLMFLGYLGMWLSPDIYIYTFTYFFAILWVSLSMTTLQALFSKSADEKSQWEVMWMSSSIDSFVSIIWPVVWTLIYWIINFSIFIIVSVIPLIAVSFYIIVFRNKLKKNTKFCH